MGNDRGDEMSSTEDSVPLELIPLHSANLLTVLDESGSIRYESPSIERVLGFDPEEPVGERVTNYFHPDDRGDALETFDAVVTGEENGIESVEYRHVRADGTYQWVESVASTTPTPGGRYVVNTRDTSERKARERELERTNERLDKFASTVGHDLRNPLQIAKFGVERALETDETEHLEAVAQAHDRMESLIKTLLTLARAGERIDETVPVDPAALCERCWQTVATGDATLVTDVDGSIEADRQRLRQLLENLLRNAIEHVGEGVSVTVGELEDEDGFYVEDAGPGIPEEKREDVLESGYSTREGGTGLGLAIVSDDAEAHGWDVEITDGDDGGTRIEVSGVELV